MCTALVISMALVLTVIYLFLGNIRATAIPAVSIPVSIIASLTFMDAMGYSINVLTLLGMVLAIGLVVDDAIVVLENIFRRIELGQPPLIAALDGSKEIGFAVIATTLVLVSVFVPISFLPGAIGRLFREFGLTLAVAVLFSSLVALTLTPAMASRIFRPDEGRTGFAARVDRSFHRLSAWYERRLGSLIRRPWLVLSGTLALVLLAGLAERYRSTQILSWLYQKGAHFFDEMTNLSKRFRQELAQISFISTRHLLRIEQSRDGTKKFLFQLEDGNRIESVLIPDKKRLTLCLSTQVGCAFGCRFCLTGKMGWKRDLSVSEIVNQILGARETLEGKSSMTNVVLMGMGEPLANYDNTLKAIQLMVHPEAFKLSSRRITLSTAGLLPELERLSKEKISFSLAISLNASDEETRSHHASQSPISIRKVVGTLPALSPPAEDTDHL